MLLRSYFNGILSNGENLTVFTVVVSRPPLDVLWFYFDIFDESIKLVYAALGVEWERRVLDHLASLQRVRCTAPAYWGTVSLLHWMLFRSSIVMSTSMNYPETTKHDRNYLLFQEKHLEKSGTVFTSETLAILNWMFVSYLSEERPSITAASSLRRIYGLWWRTFVSVIPTSLMLCAPFWR